MARISKQTQSSLAGIHVIDIEGYNKDVDDYLRNRGAEDWNGWVSAFQSKPYTGYQPLHFPGCKAFHHNDNYTRLFMPTEDEALLFVYSFGHLIRSTHVRKINDIMKETHE